MTFLATAGLPIVWAAGTGVAGGELENVRLIAGSEFVGIAHQGVELGGAEDRSGPGCRRPNCWSR